MRLSAVIVFALLALVALPASALAVDEPDAITDPPAAFAEGAEATIDLDAVEPEAAAAAAPATTAPATGGGAASTARTNVAPAASRQPTSGAQLPFTGVETDLAIALGLLGVLLVAAGITVVAVPSRGRAHAGH